MVLIDTEVGLNARQFLAVNVTANAKKDSENSALSRKKTKTFGKCCLMS